MYYGANRKPHVAALPGARLGRRLRSRAVALRAAARGHGGHPGRNPDAARTSASSRAWPLRRMGCQAFQVVVHHAARGRVRRCAPPALRTALQQIAPVVAALAGSTLVVDCTVEGPDARSRTAGHPERRRPRHLREQRAPRGAGPPGARRCDRAAGQGARQAAARREGDARDLGRRHRPDDRAGRRDLRRQLGLHDPARAP